MVGSAAVKLKMNLLRSALAAASQATNHLNLPSHNDSPTSAVLFMEGQLTLEPLRHIIQNPSEARRYPPKSII